MSTAEEFRQQGIVLRPGDPSRQLKLRQFHQRLLVTEKDGKFEVPMMQIYNNCIHFIRTIPTLVINPNNVEDVDTDSEDHVFDEAALLCMARPLQMAGVQWKDTLEKPNKKPRTISEVAHLELERTWENHSDFSLERLY